MSLTKVITFLLLAVHGILALWAVVGFAEWFWATPPWPRISNAIFPRDILLIQWTLTFIAASVFIGGYILKWPNTPVALACVYAAMAALCAVETFGYMEGTARFVAMGAEYLAYAGILVFLYRIRIFQSV